VSSVTKLMPLLEKVDPKAKSRLPLATTMADYRDILFVTDLFGKCATIAADLEQAAALARASGKVPADHKGLLSLAALDSLLDKSGDYSPKRRLSELTAEIRHLDMCRLQAEYWNRVYGVYDRIPHPGAPRAEGATDTLFRRFHYRLAVSPERPNP